MRAKCWLQHAASSMSSVRRYVAVIVVDIAHLCGIAAIQELARSDCVKLWWSVAEVGFNSRYWLHCQRLYLPFLNLRVSRTKIENLRWQFGEEINCVIFGKFVTSLVQTLMLLGVHKNGSQGSDYKSVCLLNMFWPMMLQNFQKFKTNIFTDLSS